MKTKRLQFVMVVTLCLCVAVILLFMNGCSPRAEYLRIHIRANSNSQADQTVKYAVKEQVVALLTPQLEGVTDKATALEIVQERIPQIEQCANEVLERNGFGYGARAKICAENFPTRTYETLTLESGVYDALILELGSGTGDNWWCVVFPPLCFAASGDGETVVYRSLLVKWWHEIFG